MLTDSRLSEADSIALLQLISKCPGVDGACIIQARALYNAIYTPVLFYEDCLQEEGGRRGFSSQPINNQHQEWNPVLFPNPTLGRIFLSGFGGSESIEISVQDVIGRRMAEFSLKETKNSYEFELELKKGIYLVSISTYSGKHATRKIIITE